MHEGKLRIRRRGEAVGLADHIGHAFAEGDHQIGLPHRAHQLRLHAVADVAGIVRVVAVEQMRAAMRRCDRQGPGFRQPAQRVELRGRALHRAANEDQRALGGGEARGKVIDLRGHRAGRGARARPGHGVVAGGVVQHVFREDHGDGAGRAGFGKMEGAGNGLAGLLRHVHVDDRLGDVGQQLAVVMFLQREAAAFLALHLADQQHHGDRVVQRGVQADHGVGHAGSAGDEADTRAATAHPAIGNGHVGGATLMPADDEAELRHIHQRIRQAEETLAGDAEHAVHAMRGKALGDEQSNAARHQAAAFG